MIGVIVNAVTSSLAAVIGVGLKIGYLSDLRLPFCGSSPWDWRLWGSKGPSKVRICSSFWPV